ncbi:MAG: methionine gamma-lyase [Arenicella sp.]
MSKHNSNQGFATRAIHQGYDSRDEQGALCPPLHLSSTFTFETTEQGGEVFAGEREGYFYSRISNPTNDLLERRVASLENAEAAVAMASGMGAITSTLWSFLKAGDEIIVDKTLYGCTFAFFYHGLAKFGIEVISVDLTVAENLSAHLTENTKIVYFETPANPNMRLIDIERISTIVKGSGIPGIKIVVDNTYATPYLCQPLNLGADIVVHSATKYLGGHGDLVAGIVAGAQQDMEAVRLVGMKDMTGAVISPFNAMLILRGLKTLALRMQRHVSSAETIAQWLDQHETVSQVFYPGLVHSEYHALATKQMHGYGGMIAFILKGGYDAALTFMNQLNLIQRAVSLGDAETLIQHPASMTHSTYTPEEKRAAGIEEGLIRLSVGLENIDDILADMAQAI